MRNNQKMEDRSFDVIIIGAGPAGLGVAVVLEKMGINYAVLEKETVGATFTKWPKETRLISPSFTANSYGLPDLNAIVPNTSPAFSLMTEHPSGEEYSDYLMGVCEYFDVLVHENTIVTEVFKNGAAFEVATNRGDYISDYVIWAAGEYDTPRNNAFIGSDLAVHYAQIQSFRQLSGDEYIIIGAYESGFDAAVNLALEGKKVILLDRGEYLDYQDSDSSYALSPFTRDRIKLAIDLIDYQSECSVQEITKEDGMYNVTLEDGRVLKTEHPPINCTGFDHGMGLIEDYMDFVDGFPELNDFDRSSKTEGLYLVGPKVKHDNALFCFIYKYRQRFAIVAAKIAMGLHVSGEVVQDVVSEYMENNFYLSDLSCCGDECQC